MPQTPGDMHADRDPGDLVETQLAGKDELRPIVSRLSSIVEELGSDVEVEPRESSIAFSRGREFAVLQPATAKRLDVGLVLPNTNETQRLRPAGSFGSGGITHRVSLAHEDEIDAELVTWLRDAYDAAAK